VHGAFVADHEVHTVVRHLRTLGPPDYVAEVLRDGTEAEAGDGPGEDFVDAESDPLYDQAVRVVLETRRASISGVQRRLKIGYNRAARMIEAMEHAGLVGPLLSNGSREVLVPASPDD
jgi:S-DNA-T family DNA segregation ATPase FtsK/SpoIIIE